MGGWLVHRRCAVESAAGADGRGKYQFGVAIRDGAGVSRRRTFRLTEMVPRIHMRYDRTTPDGAHQQRQLETLWRSLTLGVEEAASQGECGQDVERELEESEEFLCTYCGWPLDNSSGESGKDDALVPVPCAHGGFVHTRCMMNRAENLARGYADPRPCVACRSAWPGESRPPHPAELARGISMDGHEGRWGPVRGALRFATRVQRHISGLESASYVTTVIYGTFELMLHAHGRSSTPRTCYAPYFVMRWTCLKGHTSIFPDQGNEKRRSADTVRCSLRTPSNRRISYFESYSKDLHCTSRPTISSRPRRRTQKATNEVDPRGPKRVGSG